MFCPRADSSLQEQEPKAAVLLKAGLPPQTQEPMLKFYQGLNRCGSFPLLSAPHSLFSIWTDLKRSEKIPGAPSRRWGERIWLTGPSGLHRNLPHGLNISSIMVFDQIRDPEIPIPLLPYNLKSLLIIIQFHLTFVADSIWENEQKRSHANRVVGSALPYFLLIGTNIVHHQ